MKKIIVAALALTLGAVSTSCKKDLDKISNSVLNSVGGAADVQAIIDFNNNFLDSYKMSSDHIENILKYSESALLKSKGGDVLIMPVVVGSMDLAIGKINNVPAGFGKANADIEKEFQNYKAKKENIQKKFEELKSYMNSEDFKDDKGAKAEALKKEIESDAKDFFTSAENIVVKIKPATDDAEEVILKDHPLKKYILSSKNVMNSLDSVYDVLGKQYEGKFIEAEAQKKYDEFAKIVENNTKLEFDVKDQQHAYKKTSFEHFNKSANNFLDTFRKLIRNSKASGQISDSDIQQIDSAYDSVLNSYNSFVK